jgi:hypothetical protein
MYVGEWIITGQERVMLEGNIGCVQDVTPTRNKGGHPKNTIAQDSYSTCPERDPLFCELTALMLKCSEEQVGGCDRCKVSIRCAEWLDRATDVSHGNFSPKKLARCKAEFAVIRAGKNGHNGNGQV